MQTNKKNLSIKNQSNFEGFKLFFSDKNNRTRKIEKNQGERHNLLELFIFLLSTYNATKASQKYPKSNGF